MMTGHALRNRMGDKMCRWLIVCCAVLCSGCSLVTLTSDKAKSEICGLSINTAVGEGRFGSAVKKAERCIEWNRAELEERQRQNRQGKTRSDVLLGVTLGHFICAEAQLFAMRGAFSEAEKSLEAAKLFDRANPDFGLTWSVNGSILPLTEAFILEKNGDFKRAAEAYEAILAAANEKGWGDSTDSLYGRLAVTALELGDDDAAERFCRAAPAEDAGAKAALADLLLKRGDKEAAKHQYEAAQMLLAAAAESANPVLPVYFTEGQRVRKILDSMTAP